MTVTSTCCIAWFLKFLISRHQQFSSIWGNKILKIGMIDTCNSILKKTPQNLLWKIVLYSYVLPSMSLQIYERKICAAAQYTGFRIRAAQMKWTIGISNNLYMGYHKKSNQKKIILTCGNSEKKKLDSKKDVQIKY